ncbi:MAG TPA: polyprenyl synthetase family protein [Deltaproteobacteria bacterium]|nr:polyprenyl synthetase family protein [Deltaproteobacteria bacterium]HPJ93574.1 polyprenyl synthetase family protein [Deltaproteobacteria bacterium]
MNAAFEERLREIIHSSTPYTQIIGEYILDSGGKRLRPKLVELIGRAVGLRDEQIDPLSYAVELMHTASLLHDDVVDGTEIRRAKPTANQVFGDKPALLTGDFISSSALEIMCSLGSIEVMTAMVQTIKKMAEGELKELEYARAFHDNMEVYLDIIYLKTATLFEFCTYAPGVLAGLPKGPLDALTMYGRAIGMGFQIVDDIINLTPVEDDNKDPFNDILEGKSTLPLVFLFQENPEILDTLSGMSDPYEKQQLIISHIGPGILNRSREVAQNYLDEATISVKDAGYLTDDLERIPPAIIAQINSRF